MGINTATVNGIQGTEADPEPEDVFDVLKNQRRRAVLDYLLHEESVVEFRDLVRYVAAEENDTTPQAVSPAQRNRVRTALYQHHLGKLEDNGFIEYDKRSGTIRVAENAEQLTPYLEAAEPEADQLTDYLFGLLVLGFTALLIWVPTWTTLHSAITFGVLGLGIVLYTYERSWSR